MLMAWNVMTIRYLSKANGSLLTGPLLIIIIGWIMWMMRSTNPLLTVMTLIGMPSKMSCAGEGTMEEVHKWGPEKFCRLSYDKDFQDMALLCVC